MNFFEVNSCKYFAQIQINTTKQLIKIHNHHAGRSNSMWILFHLLAFFVPFSNEITKKNKKIKLTNRRKI
jgi:hypothetical protein